MPTFTIFNPAGDTIQAGPSLVDLLTDPAVQISCADPTLCLTLIVDGKQQRNMSLEQAVANYIDVTKRDAQVTAMHEEAARMTDAANWLGAVPLPVQPLPVEPEPEPEPLPAEPAPTPVRVSARRKTAIA